MALGRAVGEAPNKAQHRAALQSLVLHLQALLFRLQPTQAIHNRVQQAPRPLDLVIPPTQVTAGRVQQRVPQPRALRSHRQVRVQRPRVPLIRPRPFCLAPRTQGRFCLVCQPVYQGYCHLRLRPVLLHRHPRARQLMLRQVSPRTRLVNSLRLLLTPASLKAKDHQAQGNLQVHQPRPQ